MATGDLPEPVRALITRHVASVLELDVLLAARSSDGEFTGQELARELRLNEAACQEALDKFAKEKFVTANEHGYSYSPRTAEAAAAVDALADTYARRRVSVIRFIYQRPSRGVSAFADAFKLRKDD